jgi:hypothetical protein
LLSSCPSLAWAASPPAEAVAALTGASHVCQPDLVGVPPRETSGAGVQPRAPCGGTALFERRSPGDCRHCPPRGAASAPPGEEGAPSIASDGLCAPCRTPAAPLLRRPRCCARHRVLLPVCLSHRNPPFLLDNLPPLLLASLHLLPLPLLVSWPLLPLSIRSRPSAEGEGLPPLDSEQHRSCPNRRALNLAPGVGGREKRSESLRPRSLLQLWSQPPSPTVVPNRRHQLCCSLCDHCHQLCRCPCDSRLQLWFRPLLHDSGRCEI